MHSVMVGAPGRQGYSGVPRGPGEVYKRVATEVKGCAWRAAMRCRARIDVVDVPSLKEVHVIVGRTVFSVKVVERRWWVSPRLLYAYARSLLRHAREYGRSAHLILLVPRLTGGALRLAATRLRWIRLIPYRSMGLRGALYWLLTKLLEALHEAIDWRRGRGLPTRWLEGLAKEVKKSVYELEA